MPHRNAPLTQTGRHLADGNPGKLSTPSRSASCNHRGTAIVSQGRRHRYSFVPAMCPIRWPVIAAQGTSARSGV
jgi:hypothetical protein